MGQRDNGIHVQVDFRELPCKVGLREISGRRSAGIVHQEFDSTQVPYTGNHGTKTLGCREIGNERLYSPSPRRFVARQCRQTVASPRHCEHVVSPPRQLPRKY
jgi:hypothetical protein